MTEITEIYNATVSSTFDCDTKIYTCGSFDKEKDVVMAVIKKVFENDLISRQRYLEFIQDAFEDGHADVNGEIEKIENMTDEEFMTKRVEFEVSICPTIDNLKQVCYDYSGDYTHEWNFCIQQNIQQNIQNTQ